jgi:hypothetical protein
LRRSQVKFGLIGRPLLKSSDCDFLATGRGSDVGELLPAGRLIVRDAKLGQCLRSINFLTRREQVGSLTLRLFHCLQQLPRLPLGPQPDLAGAGANVGPLEQPRGDRHDDARRGNEGQPLKVERPFDAAANSAFSPDPGHQ